MKVQVTPPARQDIKNIETYIKEEFDNPTAAKRAAAKIIKSAKSLGLSPYKGFSAKGKYGIDTSYRILVREQYLIFYEVNEDTDIVNIVNVFHSKQNYINKLFPGFQYEYDIDEENLEGE
ncbi:MAG: type II toxin-antitoxin system RelE/ParE family toxin [Oscillospiraceae bacterium]|nr:type II toxin-antitoxin system RelE/ParE family toxin [Oscillospiraceae bacterium]